MLVSQVCWYIRCMNSAFPLWPAVPRACNAMNERSLSPSLAAGGAKGREFKPKILLPKSKLPSPKSSTLNPGTSTPNPGP